MFLAEFLYRALKEEAPNEPLFAYLQHSIRWLDECEGRSFANFHLVFLMRLSRFLGLYPNVDDTSPAVISTCSMLVSLLYCLKVVLS